MLSYFIAPIFSLVAISVNFMAVVSTIVIAGDIVTVIDTVSHTIINIVQTVVITDISIIFLFWRCPYHHWCQRYQCYILYLILGHLTIGVKVK